MKKIAILCLIFAVLTALCSCAGEYTVPTGTGHISDVTVSTLDASTASSTIATEPAETTAAETTAAETTPSETAATESTTAPAEPPATPEERGYVLYSDFGATGKGTADDFLAVAAAHEYANAHGLPVKADSGATYLFFVNSVGRQIDIKTDTDWTGAKFIIDDRCIIVNDNRTYQKPIFRIAPSGESRVITSVTSLKKTATNIGFEPGEKCLAFIEDTSSKVYIRTGIHENSGYSKREVVLLDEHGNIDDQTPLTWDYDSITSITLYPTSDEPITVKGGKFHTVANKQPWKFTYFARNIKVERSNVTLENITHTVEGETDDGGAPYEGFVYVSKCANVTVKNCIFTPHYIFAKMSSTESNTFGYDIHVNTATNVEFIGCTQTLPIENNNYWGVFTSNFARNITLENCVLSRFDAHMGVYNVTIKGCTLGHQGIRLIGFGTALIENTTVRSSEFINLREDYGSTFDGTVIIRNCRYEPMGQMYSESALIRAKNNCDHYYGYRCYFPRLDIDGLVVDDRNKTTAYKGIYILPKYNDRSDWFNFENDSGYFAPETVRVKGLVLLSGYEYKTCVKPYLFNKTEFVTE